MNNYSALEYNLQVFNRLHDVCNPLFAQSCVQSFRYFRVFRDGSYINLSTNQEWLIERVTQIPNNGITFHHPLRLSTEDRLSFHLWENHSNDVVLKLFKKFNIFHGITAYRRNGDSVEAWSFGATNEDSQAPDFYINNMEFLRAFISHFNRAAKLLIDTTDKSKLARFSDPISIEPPKPWEHSLLPAVYPGVLTHEKKSPLASREVECLQFLSVGKTAKETAKCMGISPRTVESYVNSIKRKLDLRFKSEIITYYWEHLSLSNNAEMGHSHENEKLLLYHDSHS